ncbi:MAG: hypothetical protein M0R02_02230 [Bacteroidales bacterium]|nr:hypothetical protein [Bacteroidales bacterium]
MKLISLFVFIFLFIAFKTFNNNDLDNLIAKYSTSTSVIDTFYVDLLGIDEVDFIIKDSLQISEDGISFYKKNIVISVDSLLNPYKISFFTNDRQKMSIDNSSISIESSIIDSVIYLKE